MLCNQLANKMKFICCMIGLGGMQAMARICGLKGSKSGSSCKLGQKHTFRLRLRKIGPKGKLGCLDISLMMYYSIFLLHKQLNHIA